MEYSVAVWPDARVRGWSSPADIDRHKWPVMPLEAALMSRHATDCHAVGYLVSEATEAQPRLTINGGNWLTSNGHTPTLSVAFFDVDNPRHQAWKDEDAPWDALDHLRQIKELDQFGIYFTRSGYRLVAPLARPVELALANSFLQQAAQYLAGLGVPVDMQTLQWSRCFRLPFVVRDGVAQDMPIDIDCMQPWEWSAPRKLLARQPLPIIDAPEQPADPAPPTDVEWDSLLECAALTSVISKLMGGKPIAKEGARDVSMIKTLATIAKHVNTTDPTLLYRYLYASIHEDTTPGAPTLRKLWDRCQYIAGKQKTLNKAAAVQADYPPIVCNGPTYYVFDSSTRGYTPPVQANALCQVLEEHCTGMGLHTRNKHGNPRSTSALLADYSRQATGVVATMGLDQSVFDTSSNTLYEACCSLADVRPKRHPQVETWLDLLGGSERDKLLDWLATAIQIDRPTCALYLRGVAGVGKGMLAGGIASLWGTGATSYAETAGDFNGALTRCPLVFADESMSVGIQGSLSASFRTLIGESERQLRRKFMAASTVRGAVRLVIAANNDHALALNERLSLDDINAIAARILYVKTDPLAKTYLDRIGGRNQTHNWVLDGHAPGKIAEHITWLAETRTVEYGPRFLVEGALVDFHRDLAIKSGNNLQVLGAIATQLHKNMHAGSGYSTAAAKVYKKHVLVNLPALTGQWVALTNTRPVSAVSLISALESLADGTTVQNGVPFYKIPPAAVLRAAVLLQIPNIDKVRRVLNGERILIRENREVAP